MVLGIEKLQTKYPMYFKNSPFTKIMGEQPKLPAWAKVDGPTKVEPPVWAKTDWPTTRTPNYSQYDGPLSHPESRTAIKGLKFYALG